MTPYLSPSQAYPILKTLGDFEAAGHPVHQCPHPLFYHGVSLNTPNLSCALVDVLYFLVVQLLDKLHMDDRHAERPLRVPVLDRYNDRGTMVLGKVEQVRFIVE